MADLRGAIDDLALIRAQVAKASLFQGFGPFTLGATGVLALVVGATQGSWLKDPRAHAGEFVALWFATAAISVIAIAVEMFIRAQRAHGSMAMPLIQQTVRSLMPALAAGGLLTIALLRTDPAAAWLLPGLWQIIFCVGAFAMVPMLPKPIVAVGAWYLVCGLFCIERGVTDGLSGWTMGIPFGVGQFLAAAVLISSDRIDAKA